MINGCETNNQRNISFNIDDRITLKGNDIEFNYKDLECSGKWKLKESETGLLNKENIFIDDKIKLNKGILKDLKCNQELICEQDKCKTDKYYINLDPEIGEISEKPSGSIIGESSTTLQWNFELIQEDSDVYTEVNVINETILEITVNAKYSLSASYKWDMAVCSISGINSIQYMNEDAKGGFDNAFPINLNYDKLTNYGMNSSWCNEKGNNGFVLFSGGSKNQLPKHFRIIFDDLNEKQFKLYTGSGTEILVATGAYTNQLFAMESRILQDSIGNFHLTFMQSSNIVYANSSDGGSTWSSQIMASGSPYDANLVINSSNSLFLFWLETYDLMYRESSDGGVTWTPETIVPNFDGNTSDRWDGMVSAITDNNQNIHICATTTRWENGNSSLNFLAYINYTNNGWGKLTWINQKDIDGTDVCDIETDSSGIIYIVATGNEDDDIDIWTSSNGWGNEKRISIYESTTAIEPSIYIDKKDKIVVSWNYGFITQTVGFANSTNSLATTLWTVNASIDSSLSQHSSIKIVEEGEKEDYIYIFYNNDSNYLYSYWNNNYWIVREILSNNAVLNSPAFIMGDKNNPINNTIYYGKYDSDDGGYYFGLLIIVDETPPTVYQIDPVNNAYNTTSNTIDFSYSVTDDNSIDNCSLMINNLENLTITSPAKDTTNNLTTYLPNADYWWGVNYTDASNNIGGSGDWNISINYQEAPEDTCTYTSGDWDVIFSDNCTISSNVIGAGNKLNIIGDDGEFILDANITGFANIHAQGINSRVTCRLGCFK